MEATTQTNGVNRITPVNKTGEQRSAELFEVISKTDLLAPDAIIKTSDKIAGKPLSLGGSVLLNLPDVAPRAFTHKNGARKGQTSYSMFDNRYEPITIKGVDGVIMEVRISITARADA